MTITASRPVPAIDPREVRKLFANYPSGVVALAATVAGEDRVLVASSFTVGVSLEPPLAAFAVQHSSTTWPHLRSAGRIGVSVLAASQSDLCRQLAHKDPGLRWSEVGVRRAESGAVLIDGSTIGLECSIHAVHTAGDHDLVVLQIESHTHVSADVEPLLFHRSRFRSLS